MKTIKLTISDYEDREKLFAILARNKYKTWQETTVAEKGTLHYNPSKDHVLFEVNEEEFLTNEPQPEPDYRDRTAI